MLECKFTTQDQRCPWVSASSNNRLGSSIWAAIISARYCFVYFGSRMETLLHFARRRKLFIEEGEWCCARDNTELAGVDDHRVSYFLSLCPQDVVFLECRPLAGEYPAKRLCVVRPALGVYISDTRRVRGTDSLAGCSCTSYSPPSRGMGFHKLSIVYFLRLSICPCSIDIVSHHIMS